MPLAPRRPCSAAGCAAFAEIRGKCRAHASAQNAARQHDEPWRRLYQTPRWRNLRLQVLREARYLCQCAACAKRPVPLIADTVDHIVPHRGDPRLMWDRSNLQAMSAQCHSRKTAAATLHAR